MSLNVWPDNETEQDLLGFRVHADLIRSVVTERRVLPVVLGVFGDWGGGKSSIMRMLQMDFADPKFENTVCLYFNGWMFEGYEDAKTALLSSILTQLGEHKRFGPAMKDTIVGLLKRVKWMEVAKLGIKHIGVPLAAAAMTGGVGGAVALAASVTTPTTNGSDVDSSESISWSSLIEKDPGKPDLLEVRKFRHDFAAMLAKTDIASVVILIDDLDRCLPERIIETFEAIKLFVAVEKTAFVIGADPRIVRHAIASRYVQKQVADDSLSTSEEQYSLVDDYLEKFIQIPYHLPRLSPSEIESYINLLACQKLLDGDKYSQVVAHWQSVRQKNLYEPYRQSGICEALGATAAIPDELQTQLAWSNSIADVVTDGLKGNPRQVKRMLNAMALRKHLASVAGIKVRDDVLAKLMVLEYASLPLFREIAQWQGPANGFPEQLRSLESSALDATSGNEDLPADASKDWQKLTARNWLRMQPGLAEVDLRDYFWLARDRTHSTLAGVTMIPPIIRRLYEDLVGENKGQQKIAARSATELTDTERKALLALIVRNVERHPELPAPQDALINLAESKVVEAGKALITALKAVPVPQLQAATAFRVQTLTKISGEHQTDAESLLASWARNSNTQVGKAAAKAIKPSK